MSGTMGNACNRPIFDQDSVMPDVSGALQGYFQQLVFIPVSKVINGFQVKETGNPINFYGTWIPFSERKLMMKPEGQRKWPWFQVFSNIALDLKVDEVVLKNNVQYRVMGLFDYSLNGFYEYHLMLDYSGSGPT